MKITAVLPQDLAAGSPCRGRDVYDRDAIADAGTAGRLFVRRIRIYDATFEDLYGRENRLMR